MREKRGPYFFVGNGAAEGEIFTKAVYIRGDLAEYYASLTYDKDCVLSTPEGGTLIAGYNQFASVNGVAGK